jgi:ribosomal protein S18 acetylase RimI-like enzyme
MTACGKASIDDLEKIADIFLEEFSSTIGKVQRVPSRKEVLDVLLLYQKADGLLVAKEEGDVVGFICAVPSISKVWKTLFLKQAHKLPSFLFTKRGSFITPPLLRHFFSGHIPFQAVHKGFKGRGVGKELAILAVRELENNNCKRVFFETLVDNEAIINIYSGLRFSKSKVIKQGPLEWQIMQKRA